MATVKLKAAVSSGKEESLKMPSVPLKPPVRSPSPADLRLKQDALVPSTLNLCDIDIPSFKKLEPIIAICARYNWTRPADVIDANYDQVAADLAALSWHIINCTDVETAISLAHANLDTNKEIISDYHYSKIRGEASEEYAVAMVDYKEKRGPKPDRMTDTEIRARVSVIISSLGYPKLINQTKSAKDQTVKILSRAENKINTLKKLMDRAQRHGG